MATMIGLDVKEKEKKNLKKAIKRRRQLKAVK
jgi:hypothetical protein